MRELFTREFFTRERFVTACAASWRIVLVVAIGALALAAFATAIGAGALSRFFGTAAWSLAVVAVIAGLIAEPAPRTPR